MGRHVVVGRGAVGNGVARELLRLGHDVIQISRRGGAVPGASPLSQDAADENALASAASGADALYNCVNPPYDSWVTAWPPIAKAMLMAAERSGAGLVTMGNLYPYGPVEVPMTEDLRDVGTGIKARVRAAMWRDALALHQAGRIRATEARASDFYGPDVVDTGLLASRAVPPLLKGQKVRVLGDPDMPHTFTYVPDVARTLAALGTHQQSWGRLWHVPSAEPVTQRQALTRMAELAQVPVANVGRVPNAVLKVLGLAVSMLRELEETAYQRTRPYVLDSTAATAAFGITATPLDEGLAKTVAWWRAKETAPRTHPGKRRG
jgi:nucleoside-diphosphate-sugar epimerase